MALLRVPEKSLAETTPKYAGALLSRVFAQEDAEDRAGRLGEFMAEHFANVKYACVSHETSGPVQNRQLARTAYVLCFDQFSADSMLKKIREDKSSKYNCATPKGQALKIGKRKTQLEKRGTTAWPGPKRF